MPRSDDALPPFLADTWWYGLSRRLTPAMFEHLTQRRVEQGFTAAQIVVGIPPEVGPLHPDAASDVGAAWALDGTINHDYLALARERIARMNALGLTAIVYGAWGHQIEWIGPDAMSRWWRAIIETLDDLDVIYCLTGESNLWINEADRLLPDKSTGSFTPPFMKTRLYGWLVRARVVNVWRRIRPLWKRVQASLRARSLAQSEDEGRAQRVAAWSAVLADATSHTARPFLLHPVSADRSDACVNNPELLAALGVQTGHSEDQRPALWSAPRQALDEHPGAFFVNLEPWYEGIRDRFGPADQLYAYWASMMAGARAHCYGAHGIWNVGDGVFLGHWGGQTFDQALALDTPRLLGLSHRVFQDHRLGELPQRTFELADSDLLAIRRADDAGRTAVFFPDAARLSSAQRAEALLAGGRCFLPLNGAWAEALPAQGMVVVIGA